MLCWLKRLTTCTCKIVKARCILIYSVYFAVLTEEVRGSSSLTKPALLTQTLRKLQGNKKVKIASWTGQEVYDLEVKKIILTME